MRQHGHKEQQGQEADHRLWVETLEWTPSLGTAEPCQTPTGWDWRSQNQQGETELDYENMQASKIGIDKKFGLPASGLNVSSSIFACSMHSFSSWYNTPTSLLVNVTLSPAITQPSPLPRLPHNTAQLVYSRSYTVGTTLLQDLVLEFLGHLTWPLVTTHLPSPTSNTIPLSCGIPLPMAGPGGWYLQRKNVDWAKGSEPKGYHEVLRFCQLSWCLWKRRCIEL